MPRRGRTEDWERVWHVRVREGETIMKNKIHSLVFGKKSELFVVGEMLKQNIMVYTPVVDIHGIDGIIRTDNGCYIEFQVKSRDKEAKMPELFDVTTLPEKDNFYVICFETENDIWIIPSKIFIENSTPYKTKNGKVAYQLRLKGRKKEILKNYRNAWNLLKS